MAYVTLNTDYLSHNYFYLDRFFRNRGIAWAVVTKLLCGHEPYLRALLGLGLRQICDSRLPHLRAIKAMNPEVETIFIKPPAKRNAEKVVTYADISCNSSISTVQALSQAAVSLGKQHRIIIMMETGELREGVMAPDLAAFYAQASSLPNIEVVGLGTNLACMNGVLPDYERLHQLHYWKDRLEAIHEKPLAVLSGGASVTIPLAAQGALPPAINHFRVGETLFLGTDVYHQSDISSMRQNLFTLYVDIVELHKKPNIPEGAQGYTMTGDKKTLEPGALPHMSNRAILNIGLLDIEPRHLKPLDKALRIAGASSDMMVVDIGGNPAGYKVGDKLAFHLDYMGILRLMSSKYIEKRIESGVASRLPLLN